MTMKKGCTRDGIKWTNYELTFLHRLFFQWILKDTVFLGPQDAPDHKTHPDFSLDILEKNNDECILILVIYWKKTGLVHTKISNHNIIYSS